jgi:hypothetical protein
MSGLLGLSGSLGTTLADGFQQKIRVVWNGIEAGIKAVWNSLPRQKYFVEDGRDAAQNPRAVSETSERGYCVLL